MASSPENGSGNPTIRHRSHDEPLTYRLAVGTAEDGREIRNLLRSKLWMSTRLLRQLPGQPAVYRNGIACKLNERAAKGDIIKVMLPAETSEVVPVAMSLDISYEDEEIVVVNKPAGMLTHPTARERLGSIQSGLRAYLEPQGRIPHCIHRLDRDTSGLVMFAKHAHPHHLFDEALRRGHVHRVYVALARVTGPYLDAARPSEDHRDPVDSPSQHVAGETWQTVDLPIAQHPDKPSRRVIASDGQRARTHFRVVKRQGNVALLQLVLETGRTHQIRLHMAAIGLPLVGDADYGAAVDRDAAPDVGGSGSPDASRDHAAVRLTLHRQALHAAQLGWRHPVTSEVHWASAPPPADMRAVWRRLGGTDSDWTGLLSDTSALHRVRIV